MAEQLSPTMIDWTTNSGGDVYKSVLLFKQKCSFIFEGFFKTKQDSNMARMLSLWIGDEGLDIIQPVVAGKIMQDAGKEVVEETEQQASLRCRRKIYKFFEFELCFSLLQVEFPVRVKPLESLGC
jgi:hypothetical protein